MHQMMRVRDIAAVLVHRRMAHRVAPHADTARRSNSTWEKCCEVSWSESSPAAAFRPANPCARLWRAARAMSKSPLKFVTCSARSFPIDSSRVSCGREPRDFGHFEQQCVDRLPLKGERAGIALIVDQEVDG